MNGTGRCRAPGSVHSRVSPAPSASSTPAGDARPDREPRPHRASRLGGPGAHLFVRADSPQPVTCSRCRGGAGPHREGHRARCLVERRRERAMTTLWAQPAGVLIEQADPGWEGIWALTFAAGHAAINLSLAVPLGASVELTYAAMDFREAQDELEWARPDLPRRCAAVNLGQVHPAEGEAGARAVIDLLATAALNPPSLLPPPTWGSRTCCAWCG